MIYIIIILLLVCDTYLIYYLLFTFFSVAIDIVGEMGVDAYFASTGVKLKASIYTSTDIQAHIKVEGKTKATLSFKSPMEKGEVILAQTKLIVMKGEEEEEQTGLTGL